MTSAATRAAPGTASASHVQLFSRTAIAPVRWRLLSGNNRETGRGVDTYPDAELCRIAVKEVQSFADELEGTIRRASSHAWAWHVTRGGRLIAISGKGFDRLIRCEQGLAQFIVNLRDADISSALMVSHARRW